jgi:hypothetical protein
MTEHKGTQQTDGVDSRDAGRGTSPEQSGPSAAAQRVVIIKNGEFVRSKRPEADRARAS